MKSYPDSRHMVVIRLKINFVVQMVHYIYALSHSVFRKGQYFKVTVLDDNGNIMPPSQFKKVFQDIVDTVGGVCIAIAIRVLHQSKGLLIMITTHICKYGMGKSCHNKNRGCCTCTCFLCLRV